MARDLPDRFALGRHAEAALAVLEADIVAEKASALGHHSQLVEQAMAALRRFDAAPGGAEERLRLVRRAAREVWAFFVQREACGLRDQAQIIRDYGIPGEVLARLGAAETLQK